MRFKRVLLKLSGEALAAEGKGGFDASRLALFAGEIKQAYDAGAEIAIVMGGGNIFRGARTEGLHTDRVRGDYMGMLATLINSMAMQDELERMELPCLLLSALKVDRLCEYPSRERMLHALENKQILLLAGGTGNPFFTTDSAAALRAAEIKADALVKGTRVDGIYAADPEKYPEAIKYDHLTFDQALQENLAIMDLTAFTLCRENNIPIVVYNANKKGHLLKILQGEKVGSLVSP